MAPEPMPQRLQKPLPSSIQVTDWWHLLKGLFDALKQILLDYLPSKWTEKKRVVSLETEHIISPRKSDQLREKHADQKWEQILKVQQLHQQGKKIAAIARQFHISRGTVYKYLKHTKRPDLRRSSICDPFLPMMIQSLVTQGLKTDSIEQEVRKEGYSGSRSTLNGIVAEIRRENSDHYTIKTVLRFRLIPKIWKEEDFKVVVHDAPDAFLETFPNLKIIHEVVHSF
jgi:transposase-like protein